MKFRLIRDWVIPGKNDRVKNGMVFFSHFLLKIVNLFMRGLRRNILQNSSNIANISRLPNFTTIPMVTYQIIVISTLHFQGKQCLKQRIHFHLKKINHFIVTQFELRLIMKGLNR